VTHKHTQKTNPELAANPQTNLKSIPGPNSDYVVTNGVWLERDLPTIPPPKILNFLSKGQRYALGNLKKQIEDETLIGITKFIRMNAIENWIKRTGKSELPKKEFPKLITKSDWIPPREFHNANTIVLTNRIEKIIHTVQTTRNNTDKIDAKITKEWCIQNNTIIVTPDKDGGFVIVRSQTYLLAAYGLLEAKSLKDGLNVFTKIDWKTTIRIYQLIGVFFEETKYNYPPEIWKYIQTNYPKMDQPARFRILIKTHKEKGKYRPIVGLCAWASAIPAKILSNFLRHILDRIQPTLEKLNILLPKNSMEVTKNIRDKYSMFRSSPTGTQFDFTDLYTNIPPETAITNINEIIQMVEIDKKWLWILQRHWTVPDLECRDAFLRPVCPTIPNINPCVWSVLLILATGTGCFEFNKEFYTQRSGLSMGNAAAPEIAILTLLAFEIKNPLPPNTILLRYIDDGLLISTQSKDTLTNYLNNTYPTFLPTTLENHGDRMEFLDLELKLGMEFQYSPYYKPTKMWKMAPWSKNTPTHHNKSIWVGNQIRILRNSSNEYTYKKHWQLAYLAYRNSGWPKQFLGENLIQWSDRNDYTYKRIQKTRTPNFILQIPLLPKHTQEKIRMLVKDYDFDKKKKTTIMNTTPYSLLRYTQTLNKYHPAILTPNTIPTGNKFNLSNKEDQHRNHNLKNKPLILS
jgi:hypothetical protein